VPDPQQIEVRRLDAAEVRARLDQLAAVLHDCVEGGASIGYLAPFSPAQAHDAFAAFALEIEQGRRLLVAALVENDVVGAVQVVLAMPQNQPHRAEISRMLVRRSARRRGIARRLMEQAELEARAEGKSLLVLDAVTDGDAARLYARLGWVRVGEIPDFALYPDGRFCDTTVFWKRV
jgi:GNAT superfamily N-acetyltransferase